MARVDRRLVAFLRVGIGILFLAAAWPKYFDPEGFARAVSHYHLLGETAQRVVALVLPPLELVVGVCLVLGVADAGASLLALLMLVLFTGAVSSALARGLDISCGCFDTEGGQKVGVTKLVENAGLIVAAIVVMVGDRSWLSLAALTGPPTPRDAAEAGTAPGGSDRSGA